MDVVAKLRGVDWARHGVVYAVLFGSALRGSGFRDVDIAVLFDGKPVLDRVLGLVRDIADALEMPDDRVDIVVLNRSDIPCVLVEEALGKGRIVYCRERGLCIDDIVRRLEVCWDFEISYRKLRLLETAVEAVKRSWGCSGDF
ncbi:MAG: nucleotidyltransferase domain-containing protein [Thermoprotei archaeon]|nr:MAG: nucleotidyltransferase domain-containing protein [Thermoprotei archaeon]